MKPLPWSFSSLDTLINCPWQYYNKYIAKTVKDAPKDENQLWGDRVHLAFQKRQDERTPLPPVLTQHEPLMTRLESKSGVHFCEQKVGLDRQLNMTRFFGDDVWWRGIIDYYKVDATDPRATLVDYKTGKVNPKVDQLAMFAIYIWHAYPKVDIIDARFYWTQTAAPTRFVWGRHEEDTLWGPIIPKLKQYVEAHKKEIWQKRPSGLCKGWCPVKSCEHWQPRREKL